MPFAKINIMDSKSIVSNHQKAAEHFEEAARHHREAARFYEKDADSEASHQAHLAHGHAIYAVQQQREAAQAHLGRHSDELPTK